MREPLLYLEQPETVVLGAFHIVVIEDEAGEAAVFGQDLGLRRDGLCGEDAVHRGQQRISIEQFAVASQLLDAINAAVTFISTATCSPSAFTAIISTGPMAVGYSRRTSLAPLPIRSICSAR